MWWWSIPAVVLVPVVAVSAFLLSAHAWFARFHRHVGLEVRPATVAEHLAYYLREGWAHLVVGAWHVRGLLSHGLRHPGGSERPVLLVHGFTQNGTNFWGLRRRLERRGHPTWAVSLGLPFRPVEAHARRLIDSLEQALERFPSGVDIVAHSMGGIVLRHVLAEHPRLADGVGRLVTLGSPHRGTASSRGFLALYCDVWQMSRRSPWLAALPDFDAGIEVVTVAAERDFVVYPSSTCHLPGARQVELRGLGHVGLLTDRRAHEAVIEVLAGLDPARGDDLGVEVLQAVEQA